ncbi:alpha/beta hydrolase fold domain-containing protein [Humibacter sp. RRB41]|uniref:alpha/beta hydrolase fold domain-containing protein n=1 Tax=Humibacter sp. RRB41 TaxID=2919946 RepID=UPI001FAA7ADF
MKRVEARTKIDPKRVYVTGFSNGAMMAYRLGCETDLFAAIAPIAGDVESGCNHPAAINDVLAAWRLLHTGPGTAPRAAAVAGDSAGGGLAVALLIAAHDIAEYEARAAVLMSPTIDLTSSGASMSERIDQDPISTPTLLQQLAADYLAGADPRTPLASPLFAPLAGLPPLLVLVGTSDLLLSDSERLAEAASGAGVDVELQVGDGLPHVYPLMLGTPEAAAATERIGRFLRDRVA